MNTKLLYLLSIIGIITILSGCSTTYKSTGLTGGYSDTRLSSDIFQVSFRGNGFTSREKASDFSLLRAAELTIQNGFNYFIILNKENYLRNSTYTTPTTYRTNLNTNSYSNFNTNSYSNNIYGNVNTNTYGNAYTTASGGQTINVSKPTANNTIKCFKNKPNVNMIIYEAKFIITSIKSKYDID